MGHRTERHQEAAERAVKDIRRKTRKRYSSEEKIRIVFAGLRGEDSIAELCRQEGIAQGLYYSWSKEFLEAGKKRLVGKGFGGLNLFRLVTSRQPPSRRLSDRQAGRRAFPSPWDPDRRPRRRPRPLPKWLGRRHWAPSCPSEG